MTHLEAWFAEAFHLQREGNLPGAALAWRRLLSRHPDFQDAWINYATCLRRTGRPEEAQTALARAGELGPATVPLLLERAEVLLGAGLPEEALGCQLQAVALDPTRLEARFGLGRIHHRLGRSEEALAADEAALALAPGEPGAWVNRSASLLRLQRTEEAIADARKAVALDPANPLGHLNLGIALLQNGDLAEGFAEYEWRWKVPDIAAHDPQLGLPWWEGTPFPGRTLLLWAEQGLGDSLMALRFVPAVQALGGRVILRIQASLVDLVRPSLPGVEVVTEEAAPPPADLQLPLLSLPAKLGTASLPPAPYLLPPGDAPNRAALDARLAAHPGRKVGLVWAGNRVHQDNAYRCPPLSAFAALADLPVTWVGLQRWESEMPPPGPDLPLVDLGDLLSDFRDTAHALSRLDHLLTVDTSVVHLAGALGHPALLLLAQAPDWRWRLHREDSPWYGSLRLVRQPAPGDWAGALARAATLLTGP